MALATGMSLSNGLEKALDTCAQCDLESLPQQLWMLDERDWRGLQHPNQTRSVMLHMWYNLKPTNPDFRKCPIVWLLCDDLLRRRTRSYLDLTPLMSQLTSSLPTCLLIITDAIHCTQMEPDHTLCQSPPPNTQPSCCPQASLSLPNHVRCLQTNHSDHTGG